LEEGSLLGEEDGDGPVSDCIVEKSGNFDYIENSEEIKLNFRTLCHGAYPFMEEFLWGSVR
jgi:hypothetical protein